jgi:hypothetical protein
MKSKIIFRPKVTYPKIIAYLEETNELRILRCRHEPYQLSQIAIRTDKAFNSLAPHGLVDESNLD